MKLLKITLFFYVFQTQMFGQNINMKVDSIFNLNQIDTTARPVYIVAETMPRLLNGEDFFRYFNENTKIFTRKDCVVNKAYIGFVVETDSTISNKKVYVESVFYEDKGLIREGKYIIEMQLQVEKELGNLTKMIPGKIGNKNVAIRVLYPIHVDYQ